MQDFTSSASSSSIQSIVSRGHGRRRKRQETVDDEAVDPDLELSEGQGRDRSREGEKSSESGRKTPVWKALEEVYL